MVAVKPEKLESWPLSAGQGYAVCSFIPIDIPDLRALPNAGRFWPNLLRMHTTSQSGVSQTLVSP